MPSPSWLPELARALRGRVSKCSACFPGPRPQYGLVHISAGDLLRAQVAAGTPAGKKAASFMSEGKLVPNEARGGGGLFGEGVLLWGLG